jgi:hypothetical protein
MQTEDAPQVLSVRASLRRSAPLFETLDSEENGADHVSGRRLHLNLDPILAQAALTFSSSSPGRDANLAGQRKRQI